MSGLEEGVSKSAMSRLEEGGCLTFYVWARGRGAVSYMARIEEVTLYSMYGL